MDAETTTADNTVGLHSLLTEPVELNTYISVRHFVMT